MRVRVSGSCKRKVGPKIRGKWEVQLVGGGLLKLGVGGCPPKKTGGTGFSPSNSQHLM